jgi:hypothetical protein
VRTARRDTFNILLAAQLLCASRTSRMVSQSHRPNLRSHPRPSSFDEELPFGILLALCPDQSSQTTNF